MTAPVVVAGEALIDLVPDAEGALRPRVGGGPLNAARACARLGQETLFVGALSRDGFGRLIGETLAADGVRLPAGLETDRPTSLAVADIDVRGAATYRFYLKDTSAEALTPDLARRAAPSEAAALYAGGLGLVLEPLAEAVEALLTSPPGRPLIMIDPNVRPTVIADPTRYVQRLRRLFARCDVLKVSDEDLAVLALGQAPEAAAEVLLAGGPSLVLLTRGSEGAVAYGPFGRIEVAAPRVEVVDTIGAGDIFAGTWLARWLERGGRLEDGDAVRDATRFACCAAAASCARPGAAPPDRAEIGALL